MSNEIEIEIPGLTAAVAVELDRRADLFGTPFTFIPPRRTRWLAAEQEASVLVADLREEPNVASETLDHPEGWPESDEVRQWLARAARFLGDNAPQRRFTFRAGWGDHRRQMANGDIDIETFLGLIGDGRLHADERYTVHSTE